jgi:penicillin-binding protein 1A
MRRILLAGALAPAMIFAAAPVSYLSRSLSVTPWGFALPDGDLLRQALHACQVARHGDRETTLCPQRIAFRDFPRHLVDALVASEDRTFFDHRGIDKLAILNAVMTNIARSLHDGRLVVRRGGSTITQQFARTLFLDPRDGMIRKVQELALAPRIEELLSKQQILAGYMNVIPHARGMNGFDDAARHFFAVPVQRVDLAEAALLVGMLPAPNHRDPDRYPQAAFDAAVRVLDRMVEQKLISAAARRGAESRLLERLRSGRLRRGRAGIELEETRPYRDLALAEAKRHGVSLASGYRLILHMNPALQERIVQAAQRMAGPYQAAGIVMRPTGEVLGIAGSRNYVESSYSRAFQSTQPIGSTGKLFVLVAAQEQGLDPAREFPQKPIRDGTWPAEPNRQCRSAMHLQAALNESCNRPFAWAAMTLGSAVTSVVERFELTAPDAPVLVPLGGVEATPLNLARAYAAVVNEGGLPRARALVAALGPSGSLLYDPATSAYRVMSAETAKAVRQALRGPVEHGTAQAAASRRATVYGKTGTTSDNQDAWFVGLTEDFVGAFWVGDDNNVSMRGISGSGAPAKAFAWVTDAYYSLPQHENAGERTAPTFRWLRWNPEFLRDRENRYWAVFGFVTLLIAVAWLQFRRSALGWAIRTKFGMRPLAEAVGGLWRRLRKRRPQRKPAPAGPAQPTM